MAREGESCGLGSARRAGFEQYDFAERVMNTTPARPMRDCRQPTQCKDCRAPILWVRWLRSGKRMPINVEAKQPSFGTILVVYRCKTNELIASVARGQDTRGRRLFESHLAT